MTLTMNNATGRQHPLGERSLNYSEPQRGTIDVVKVQNGARPEVSNIPRMQSSNVAYSYTPNHRRSRNTPFKSPITLCFDRMLGAGKLHRQHGYRCFLLPKFTPY
mgnify:CR=1 FL=1